MTHQMEVGKSGRAGGKSPPPQPLAPHPRLAFPGRVAL